MRVLKVLGDVTMIEPEGGVHQLGRCVVITEHTEHLVSPGYNDFCQSLCSALTAPSMMSASLSLPSLFFPPVNVVPTNQVRVEPTSVLSE
jgi:hypothetical protein